MKRLKIQLISANRHKDPYPVYPLGTAYLKAYLLERIDGCAVEILDCNLLDDESLGRSVKNGEADYIGISLRNADGANSLDKRGFLADYITTIKVVRENSAVPVIVGGAGFSIFPKEFLEILGADYGIRGEGEEPFAELIEALQQRRSVDSISTILRPCSSIKSESRSYLNSISAEFEPDLVQYYWKHSGMLNIQTKRGCPYNCIYCSYPMIDGRCVRTMDVSEIVENICRVKRDFGINYLFFTDSVFNICNSYNEQLAQALIDSGVDINWGAYFSPSQITVEQMELYKRSGLMHIEFGTESFSDSVLKCYGKQFTMDDVVRTSELALANNVFYSHFLILGGYGQTPENLRETIENSKYFKHTVFFPYVGMRIYPKTELERIAIKEGVIQAGDTLLDPKYYIAPDFDLSVAKELALRTGKSWVFPDEGDSELISRFRIQRNKKGPLWEYLRKP